MPAREKISPRLLTKLVPSGIAPGQYKFNHEGCKAGLDTKERLYIKVPYEAPLNRVAYCHHCGLSGFAKVRNTKDNILSYESNGYNINKGKIDAWRIPVRGVGDWNDKSGIFQHAEFDPTKWPLEAISFLSASTIELSEVVKHKLFFDYEKGRVGIPSFGHPSGDLVSVQWRAVYYEQKPKYLGWKSSSDESCLIPAAESNPDERQLVITEDQLSAIVCTNVGDALPLHGVHLHSQQGHVALLEWKDLMGTADKARVVVWLDNDNPQVKRAARDIKKWFDVFLPNEIPCKIVTRQVDPKHLTPVEIQKEIDNVFA